ncbi:hypothetical protein RN001_003408 [Aquatica leii]|uniref:YqaJ viral recombinase domain-containing protein n=1 Tax=Aquatica leii TaxID=1421715 RepID=A0AAN7Q9I4_9COLE|nr:hypothetical protein RN001_003408 [Aquatica leii]
MTDFNTVHIRTQGQRENITWFKERRNRLTASMFGRICKRRRTTPTDNLIKSMFYKTGFLKTSAVLYGVEHEECAIKKFLLQTNVKVESCGLFVDHQYPYLGASPDGIIDNETIVEVKCLFKIKHLKIK